MLLPAEVVLWAYRLIILLPVEVALYSKSDYQRIWEVIYRVAFFEVVMTLINYPYHEVIKSVFLCWRIFQWSSTRRRRWTSGSWSPWKDSTRTASCSMTSIIWSRTTELWWGVDPIHTTMPSPWTIGGTGETVRVSPQLFQRPACIIYYCTITENHPMLDRVYLCDIHIKGRH